MTRREAKRWLESLTWLLTTKKDSLGDLVEDVYNRVCLDTPMGLPKDLLRAYARSIIPPGKRGHARLVLVRPYEARVRALLVGILRSVED